MIYLYVAALQTFPVLQNSTVYIFWLLVDNEFIPSFFSVYMWATNEGHCFAETRSSGLENIRAQLFKASLA